MPQKNKPSILIIDDEPDKARALKTEIGNKATVEITSPEDLIEKTQITKADLILVDYRLDNWQARDSVESLCQKPMNGLALSAVLRSHVDDDKNASPTAVAILSGHLTDLSGGLPPEPRAHAIARAHSLEWAFSKANSQRETSLAYQVLSLASGVRELPSSWPIDDPKKSEQQIQELLLVPKNAIWFLKAWEEIQDCYPPVHELSEWSHGLAILRWLLHRILPYPCFLWDSDQLAARLRVTRDSLKQTIVKDSKLSHLLKPVRYQGILSDFLGTRWWRAGVESILWQITEGQSFDPQKTFAIIKHHAPKVKALNLTQPVICLDRDYQPVNEFVDISAAVRIQPDSWPPYADQAWTTIEMAKQEPRLKALVLRQDRSKL